MWTDTGLPGISARILAVDRTRSLVTLLIRAEPGAVYPPHKHHGPEECLVLSGSVVIDGRVLRVGDFHHADADTDHGEITTTEGAEVLIVGALEDYLPPAAKSAFASRRLLDRVGRRVAIVRRVSPWLGYCPAARARSIRAGNVYIQIAPADPKATKIAKTTKTHNRKVCARADDPPRH